MFWCSSSSAKTIKTNEQTSWKPFHKTLTESNKEYLSQQLDEKPKNFELKCEKNEHEESLQCIYGNWQTECIENGAREMYIHDQQNKTKKTQLPSSRVNEKENKKWKKKKKNWTECVQFVKYSRKKVELEQNINPERNTRLPVTFEWL